MPTTVVPATKVNNTGINPILELMPIGRNNAIGFLLFCDQPPGEYPTQPFRATPGSLCRNRLCVFVILVTTATQHREISELFMNFA